MGDKYDLNKEIFDDDSGITVGTPFCHEHCCTMVCFDGINFECVECNINNQMKGGKQIMETQSNWLDEEVKSLDANRPTANNYPEPLKLMENKITEIEVDFSKPFEKKPNKMNPDTVQALIPCKLGAEQRMFWLSVANPLYGQIIRAGKAGTTKFKILRVGTQKNTRYTIVS